VVAERQARRPGTDAAPHSSSDLARPVAHQARRKLCDNALVTSGHELPPPTRSRVGTNWRGMARWSTFGAVAMLAWLLAPTVHCTYVAFREARISAPMEDDAISSSDTDRNRVVQSEGFVNGVLISAHNCYRLKPVFGQESWKSGLFIGLSCVALITFVLHRAQVHDRHAHLG
jgi:hypothetical protein